jgi:hypothetical protein
VPFVVKKNGGLFTEADGEVGCQAFAGGIDTGNLQNGGFGGAPFQRQREQIRPQEILPVPVVRNGVGKIYIGPY